MCWCSARGFLQPSTTFHHIVDRACQVDAAMPSTCTYIVNFYWCCNYLKKISIIKGYILLNASTLTPSFLERIRKEALPERRYGFHKGGTSEVAIRQCYVNSCAESVHRAQLLRNVARGCLGEWYELGRMLISVLFACRVFHSVYKLQKLIKNFWGCVHYVPLLPLLRARSLITRLMSRRNRQSWRPSRALYPHSTISNTPTGINI